MEIIIKLIYGIAKDEIKRIQKNKDKILPLVDWNMSEKDCLNYCYSKGYNWSENGVELYSILDRVSCWCCGNKNKKELDNMFYYLPQYYLEIIRLAKNIKKNNKKEAIVSKQVNEFFCSKML